MEEDQKWKRRKWAAIIQKYNLLLIIHIFRIQKHTKNDKYGNTKKSRIALIGIT
jgi:hypothetical protein